MLNLSIKGNLLLFLVIAKVMVVSSDSGEVSSATLDCSLALYSKLLRSLLVLFRLAELSLREPGEPSDDFEVSV